MLEAADALPYTARRLGLRQPDGSQHVPYPGAFDFADQAVVHLGEGVALQRRDPLILILAVFPGFLVFLVDHLGGLAERRSDLPLGDRVDALCNLLPDQERCLAGISERNGFQQAQALCPCAAPQIALAAAHGPTPCRSFPKKGRRRRNIAPARSMPGPWLQ